MSKRRVVVIGGGPAGLMAAGQAAQCGAEAVLLEKGPRLARKLRISGKGRGNLTNTADLPEFIEAFAPNGKFLYSTFSRYFRDELLAFLADLGVPTKVERGGRVFPVSDRAADVADALSRHVESVGVTVRLNTKARAVAVEDNGVVGVEVFGGVMKADAVVLAAGGASYPATGSTGDGYEMAKAVGHTIVPPQPGLSAMDVKQRWIGDLEGLSLRNVEVSLVTPSTESSRNKPAASEFGEMVFTDSGVSGPVILTLSRDARFLLAKGKVELSIDLKAALSEEQIHSRLLRDFRRAKHFKNYLDELLPRKLIPTFIRLVGIPQDKRTNTITAEERTAIVSLLKDFRLSISRLRPLEEAIVTAGGVSISEIDPRTLMSKLVGGLFLAGEVIDIDAKTGGYNLQAAFSTGFVAGQSAGCEPA